MSVSARSTIQHDSRICVTEAQPLFSTHEHGTAICVKLDKRHFPRRKIWKEMNYEKQNKSEKPGKNSTQCIPRLLLSKVHELSKNQTT